MERADAQQGMAVAGGLGGLARRCALSSLLLAVLLGGCLSQALFPDDSPCSCPEGQTCCDDKCVDLATDEGNCGKCGFVCDTANGFLCSAKQCRCPGPMTDCGGVCVDTNTDSDNCGACGIACAPGETCHAGNCGGDLCPAPAMSCDGSCVDVTSDSNNCGRCGEKCDAAGGFACAAGSCECGEKGITDCDGECVDLDLHPMHCGACGCECGGMICTAGHCVAYCQDPLKVCPDDPECLPNEPCGGWSCSASCVDTYSSNDHCGECHRACNTAKGFACLAGSCECVGGTTDCSGTCVDSQESAGNCGGCGITCVSGSCIAGQCQGDAGVIYPDAGPDSGMDLHLPD